MSSKYPKSKGPPGRVSECQQLPGKPGPIILATRFLASKGTGILNVIAIKEKHRLTDVCGSDLFS